MVVKKFLPKIPLQIFAYLITKASCNFYHSYAMNRLFCKHGVIGISCFALIKPVMALLIEAMSFILVSEIYHIKNFFT